MFGREEETTKRNAQTKKCLIAVQKIEKAFALFEETVCDRLRDVEAGVYPLHGGLQALSGKDTSAAALESASMVHQDKQQQPGPHGMVETPENGSGSMGADDIAENQ